MAASRREQRTTACAICRQPVLTGERLCAPCRSALKRARDSTVSEAMVPKRRPRRRPEAPRPATPSVATDAATTPPARANWVARGVGLSLVAVLLVGGGTWITHTRGIAGTIAPRYSVAPEESKTETIDAAAAARPAPATPADKTPTASVGHDDAGASHTIDARALPSTITMPRGRAETDALAAAAALPVAPLPAPVVEPPLPAPIVVAQAPARPALDPWQRLAAELERCPPDALKRAVCQESLRIEHCEGHWGRVAACPAKVEREYGN